MRARATLGFSALVCLLGCAPTAAFVCFDDSECGAEGRCEPEGYCSFPDDECASGRRYEPNAGEGLASHCVREAGSTGEAIVTEGMSGSPTTSTATTLLSSSSSETSEGSETSSTTTGSTTPMVVIDPGQRFQTLDGMGIQAWDYPIDDPDWNWEAVAPTFDEVDVHYAQLITIFRDWEPTNDNDDPLSVDSDSFDPAGEIALHDIPMAQWLADRGYEVNVQKVLLPPWMNGRRQELLSEEYPEFAESIIAYQQRLEEAGVAQTEVELFMVGLGTTVFATPEEAAEAADVMLASLAAFDVERDLLTPSMPGSEAADWLGVWFESADRTQNTAAISVRGAATSDFADFSAVAAWGDDYSVPVWAYDNWYCGADQGCPAAPAEDSTTWASAWEMAQQNYRFIVGAHATRIYHAAMVGAQPSVDGLTGDKNPTFYVLQHFANWIPPNSVNVQSTSEIADVFTVAVERPDGSYSVILLNTGFVTTDVELVLLGPSTPSLQNVRQSVAGSYMNELQPVAGDGELVLSLPPNSLTSLEL